MTHASSSPHATAKPPSISTALSEPHNNDSTPSLTSSFLSAFTRTPSNPESSSSVGIDTLSAAPLVQRLRRRIDLWQGPSILHNRNINPSFATLASRPTSPVPPCALGEAVDGSLLAPSQGSVTATPHDHARILGEIGNASEDSIRPTSPRPTSPLQTLLYAAERHDENTDSFAVAKGVLLKPPDPFASESAGLDACGADMRSHSNVRLPGQWPTPLSPISPNSCRASHKGLADSTPRTEQYIQHLETQIATLSDSVSRHRNSHVIQKIKQLTRDKSILQQELCEWERKYEDRVQEEMASARQREAQLRAQARRFQIESKLKDQKLYEQAREIRAARHTLREANSTNRELEQRIDDLTGLLAQSPIMSEPSPPAACNRFSSRMSVDNTMPSPRLPVRPRSMINVGSNEGKATTTPARRHSHSLQTPMPHKSATASLQATPATNHEDGRVPSLVPEVGDLSLASSDPSALRDSIQFSPMSSETSTGGYAPSIDTALNRYSMPAPCRSHRRMRRFPSGSHQLKPLVLQNASELKSTPTPQAGPGRLRRNSYPYTPSNHSHPARASLRSATANNDLHTISDDEERPNTSATDDDQNVSPRNKNTRDVQRSRDLERANTLNALEGGRHQPHKPFDDDLVNLKLGPYIVDVHRGSDDNEVVEPSDADRVVVSGPAPPFFGRDSGLSVSTFSSPLSDLDFVSTDGSHVAQAWPAGRKSFEDEMASAFTPGIQSDVTSDGTQWKIVPARANQATVRTGSYRYKYRRPTVDQVMFSSDNSPPVLVRYQHSPQSSVSVKRPGPASQKEGAIQNVVPHSQPIPRPGEHLGASYATLARRIICNTLLQTSSLRGSVGRCLGGYSWWFLGLLRLDRRKSSPSQQQQRILSAHKTQDYGSLIDGFNLAMTKNSPSADYHSQAVARAVDGPASFGYAVVKSAKDWSRFAVAVVLAVGLAACHGPSSLMSVEQRHVENAKCPYCSSHLNTRSLQES